MATLEPALHARVDHEPPWLRYGLDSMLAFGGALLVTSLIVLLHLYPRIPNISIIYLLVILALASSRGRYAAILASVVAFLAFDYFLVPPLYVFTINRAEEWIALIVFLITALFTSQLAAALRERAEQADRRERETHLLYDLLRLANREEVPERQLASIAQTIIAVFASWGVSGCSILQPDQTGRLQLRASAAQEDTETRPLRLSSDELAVAARVLAQGRAIGLDEEHSSPSPAAAATRSLHFLRRILKGDEPALCSLYLLPLTMGQKVIGVLHLRISNRRSRALQEELLSEPGGGRDHPVSFFWTFLDHAATLIERARLQQENLHIALLKRTDALRAALLSSVSHDLRTPLTSIKAAASALLQEDVAWNEPQWRGFARTIEREADRLNRLVSNLLDMSRIEEGALQPEREWYSLKALVQDVLGRLAPLLVGRPLHLHLPNDLLLVPLDYLQIDQVITNILENAVHHTPPGSPIDVWAALEGDQAIVRIGDHGPGIPPEDLERIFDKFYRVVHGKRGSDSRQGSGLGLAVCKGLVEAHGGQIRAELRPEGGLIMTVTLPRGGCHTEKGVVS
jgi:two-component system sensor histidine kinase KdpD